MQDAIRTTIRIRQDLLNQSRFLALEKGTSLQEIVNTVLALGFGKVGDLGSNKQAMAKIDKFRISLVGRKVDTEKLLNIAKSEQK